MRPPFSPEAVTTEFARLLKSGYGVSKIIGDRYAGEWPKEQFGKLGIRYEQSAKPKSDLYVDLLAAINSRRVALLDHPRLINQLVSLERRTARSGRDSIDHTPGGHDDVANCVAGLCAVTAKPDYYARLLKRSTAASFARTLRSSSALRRCWRALSEAWKTPTYVPGRCPRTPSPVSPLTTILTRGPLTPIRPNEPMSG